LKWGQDEREKKEGRALLRARYPLTQLKCFSFHRKETALHV